MLLMPDWQKSWSFVVDKLSSGFLYLFWPVVFFQTLSRLLNSTNQEDLRAANKLIKEMVQEVSHLFC